MGDTQRGSSPASPRAGSLEPATSASRTDPWPSTLDLGTRKERGALDNNNNQRENVMGEGERDGGGRNVGVEERWEGRGRPQGRGSGSDGRETLGRSPPMSPRGLPSREPHSWLSTKRE
jgi:hypothetical protein